MVKPGNSEIIMYKTPGGHTKIDVRLEGETLWLTQAQMAQLFGRDTSVISRHIKNIFSEGELDIKSNLQNLQIANSDKPVTFYTLDVIIAVGYRVKSNRGTQFRQWATAVLREYLQKGFALNDEILKSSGGGLIGKNSLTVSETSAPARKFCTGKSLTSTLPAWIMMPQKRKLLSFSKSCRINCITRPAGIRQAKLFLTAPMRVCRLWV
jgi:hypothetical protein